MLMVGGGRVCDEWVFRRYASDVATSKAGSKVGRDHRHTVGPAANRRCVPSGRFKREVGCLYEAYDARKRVKRRWAVPFSCRSWAMLLKYRRSSPVRDRCGTGQVITSLCLPARHDAITARSPTSVPPRPSKTTGATFMPLRGSQDVLSPRGDCRVLDLHATQRRFLVSDQSLLPVLRLIPEFLKVYPPRFALFATQLTMG